MNGIEFLDKMEYVDADLIEAAETDPKRKRKPVWIKWGAMAACLCLVAAGVFALFNSISEDNAHSILRWSVSFSAEDYFKYAATEGDGISTGNSIADSAIAYAETRYFSDQRGQLESDAVIPVVEDHPLFSCSVHYNDDGSIYSVVLSWDRRGDRSEYSDLKITAGYQKIEQIEDCIFIELDEDGNIIEPAVTVTERGGIQIVAEGREDQDKTITFQNDSGWYQISGSWNDDYDSVVMLLDWIWEHPLDFGCFPIESGDEYTTSSLAEYPNAFSDCLPDFTAFGFVLSEEYLSLKNGEPESYEGHYVAHVDDETLVKESTYYNVEGYTELHWCVFSEPDIYDLQECVGKLDDLTEAQVLAVLAENSSISFKCGDCVIKIYPSLESEAWELIESLRKNND
ncbi:MAG: hypothetical protein AB7C97_03215 [Oscillospiraceae bacterium]